MAREYFLSASGQPYRTHGIYAQAWTPRDGWFRSVCEPRMHAGFRRVPWLRAQVEICRRWWIDARAAQGEQ